MKSEPPPVSVAEEIDLLILEAYDRLNRAALRATQIGDDRRGALNQARRAFVVTMASSMCRDGAPVIELPAADASALN